MGAKRVLVVDDESAVRQFVSAVLKSKGFEVCEAENGLTAKKVLEHQEFDIVVTDIKMPKVNGIELGRHIQAVAPRLAVLYMSGLCEPSEGWISPGQFLPKPFTPNVLLDAVLRLIDNSLNNTAQV